MFLLDLLPQSINCSLSVILLQTLQPGILHLPLLAEHKKSIFIDIPHFLLLLHVEWFNLISEVLYLLLQIICGWSFAIGIDRPLHILAESIVLLLLLFVEACLLLLFAQVAGLLGVLEGLLCHISYKIKNKCHRILSIVHIEWSRSLLVLVAKVSHDDVLPLLDQVAGQLPQFLHLAHPVALD